MKTSHNMEMNSLDSACMCVHTKAVSLYSTNTQNAETTCVPSVLHPPK